MIDFRGSTVVDCPETLQTGLDIVVSLSVYLLPKAFKSPKISPDDSSRNMFDEGAETLDEQELRERKNSLLHLFDSIGLRPLKGSGLFGKKSEADLKPDDVLQLAERPDDPKTIDVRKEVVGDGEEIEVETDGEDLSENQLNMIYKRSCNLQNFSHALTSLVC